MSAGQLLLDPTSEQTSNLLQRTPAPASLDGLTVALLDITKAKGDVFLKALGTLMTGHGIKIRHYEKLTSAKPASPTVGQTIAAECDVVVEALAD